MFASSSKLFFPWAYSVRTAYGTSRIGNRDVVGHGRNGANVYADDAHFPFPAIRFLENTRHICALRLKEKGDWRMLSCEEKKLLYRASFCQTFSEFQANNGQWKLIIGGVLFTTSFGFWGMTFLRCCAGEDLPESTHLKNQKQQLRRMLDIRTNPIDGIGSLWNYDEDDWKVNAPGISAQEQKMAKTED